MRALLKILFWFEATFDAKVAVTICNPVPTFGAMFHPDILSLERVFTMLLLQILQLQKLVQASTKVLKVYKLWDTCKHYQQIISKRQLFIQLNKIGKWTIYKPNSTFNYSVWAITDFIFANSLKLFWLVS